MAQVSKSTTFVETVNGPIPSFELGRTLTHEHLALDFHKFYTPAPDRLQEFINDKITLHNVGVVRQYPYASKNNLCFNDSETLAAVLEDVRFFQSSGGGTIVENTSYGLKRNIPFLKDVSMRSGVNIVVGTGHYVALTQDKLYVNTITKEQLYHMITEEITIGCDKDVLVKAGFIGEVASTWPIEQFERKAIEATGEAQEELKCPVSFHSGRDRKAPYKVMRIYMEAGGDPKKAIMSHVDRTFTTVEDLLDFASIGCYCQHDLFGVETSFYQLNTTIDMPSDGQRLDRIRGLIRDGKLNKVLMSHDIHTKHRLMKFGGHGYAHILNNVVPQMRNKGFSQEEIDTILIENPKVWLSPTRGSLEVAGPSDPPKEP